MTALSQDALSSCLIASGVLLLFFHIHAERESFQSFQSWCWRVLQHAIPRCQTEAEYQKQAMHVRRMVDQARARNFKTIVRVLTGFVAFSVAYRLPNLEANRYVGMLAFLLIVYAIGLFIAYSQSQWSPMKMTAIMTLVHFIMLARTCMIQDPGIWFLQSHNRAILRLVMGIMDMDHRRAAMWSLLFTVTNTIKSVEMTENLLVVQRPVLGMLINDGTLCAMVWLSSYIAQMLVTDCVQTAFEASASRMDKTMTDHLLSAFCDVQVKLGSNLQVVGHHEKLNHILLVRSPDGREPLHGISFLDYVASADKARFKAFIEASSAPSDRCADVSSKDLYERPKTLPSALHVHLRDSSGRYLPVSIFHSAAKIADGESHHLIGICVESTEDFTETQQTPGESAEQANQFGQADQNCHYDVPSKKKNSSLSSRSSSSSNTSKRSLSHLIDLPLIESVSVTFDPFQWSIHKVCWNLSDSRDKVATLDDCLLQPDGREFRSWVQDQVNNVLFAEDEDSDQECQSAVYGSLTLKLPRLFCGKNRIVISAKSAWFDPLDLDEDPDDQCALVSLHLEGVQQISDAGRLKASMSTISE